MKFLLFFFTSVANAVQPQLSSEFVDLSHHPSIRLDIRYATNSNFTGMNLYGDWRKCYLHKDAAKKFNKASKTLSELKPGWKFLVFDCLRPRSVQRQLWSVVKGTPNERYVANPDLGSIHNYGFAVDLSLVDKDGNEVDMGTPYDSFAALSEPRYEAKFLAEGKLSALQVENRRTLRTAMETGGFKHISNEWWHFDGQSREAIVTNKKLKIVE